MLSFKEHFILFRAGRLFCEESDDTGKYFMKNHLLLYSLLYDYRRLIQKRVRDGGFWWCCLPTW